MEGILVISSLRKLVFRMVEYSRFAKPLNFHIAHHQYLTENNQYDWSVGNACFFNKGVIIHKFSGHISLQNQQQ